MVPLEIKDLGLIGYAQAFEIQKHCVEEVLRGGPQALILCEHPAVLTLGRLTDQRNLLADQDELKKRGIEVIPINRGGDVTLHAPGQLVVYAILDLNNFGKDLKSYCSRLEQVAIDLLSDFDIVANRILGKTGVWAGPKKIVSLGIGVKKWVSFHGLGINVNTDLKLFSLIRPCGMDVAMTSISEIRKYPVDMAKVKERLAKAFLENFNLTLAER